MELKTFKDKLKSIKKRYIETLTPILKECKQFIGLSAIIPHGYYAGRWGKITDAFISDDGEVFVIIQPYRIKGDKKKLGELLWDKYDARTFWKLSDVKNVKIKEQL